MTATNTITSAMDDLRRSCAAYNEIKESQSISDLEGAIQKARTLVEDLNAKRDYALDAADAVEADNASLAFALRIRASDLLVQVEHARPHNLEKKQSRAIEKRTEMRTIMNVLSEL